MFTRKIQLGATYTQNNVFLAPLAGYTNAVFRQMCYDLGAGLTFTEMVSAKGLCYNNEATAQLLQNTPQYGGIKAVQLFGSEPEYIQKAAQSKQIAPFDVIDINMGCPVPKIYKNGEGSALMGNLPLASKVIKAAKTSGKTVTVKFRIGLNEKHYFAADFAKMCEDSGADLITVHGRSREKIYAGDVHYDQIAAAKAAVKIPVVANGGVFCKADAQNLLTQTGADGVMVARGALFAPWIFAEITGKPYDKKTLILSQLEQTKQLYGERFTCVFMRKMVTFYIKGMRGNAAMKTQLFAANTCDEVTALIHQIDWNNLS